MTDHHATGGPLLLLDVDDVINARRPGWSCAPRATYVHHRETGTAWRMRWAPPLVRALRELHESGALEIRWATSWVNEARSLEQTFGLPRLEVAFDLDPGASREHITDLKRGAALEAIAAGRRLAWADDDAIWSQGPERERLTEAGVLLIEPDPRCGMQPSDVEALAAWCDGKDVSP